MNWKNEAIEKLESYGAMRQSIQSIVLEIKRLELEADAIRSACANSPAVMGGSGRREDRLLNNIVQRQELQRSLDLAKIWLETTDQALGSLRQEEKQLLEQMYMSPKWGNVNQLSMDIGLARGTIYRKRDEALRKFTLALYGATES